MKQAPIGLLVALLFLTLSAVPAVAGILIRATSEPTLTTTAPKIEFVAPGGPSCSGTLNVNKTSSDVTATSQTGEHSDCGDLKNNASSTYRFKIRYVTVSNLSNVVEFTLKTKSGGDEATHVRLHQGTVEQTEPAGWVSASAGAVYDFVTTTTAEAGTAPIVTLEVKVAPSSTATVYALYDFTVTIDAT